ncbi:MAG: guanylate kinase [Bacteroidales bacterium]|nr:guanylate kinase [Bacteroidales bacterium]
MKGKLIIFSAPSGSGKTTIVNHLLEQDLPLSFSISACTRTPRNNEQHGKDYYFLSVDEFKTMIEREEFIEWEEVYKGHFYGTLKSELTRIWSLKKHVVFDVDVAGGVNLKEQFADQALALFIMPPSISVLKDRLENRSTDSPEKIKIRLEKSEKELEFADKFDLVIVNDQLNVAVQEAYNAIVNFLKSG